MPYLITAVCLLACIVFLVSAAYLVERRDRIAAAADLERHLRASVYGVTAPVSPPVMNQADLLALLAAMRADRTEHLEVIARTISTVTATAVQSILVPGPVGPPDSAPASAPVYQLVDYQDDPADPTEMFVPRLGGGRTGAVVGDDGDIGIPGFRFQTPDGAA